MRKLLRHKFLRLRMADEGQALVLVAFGLMVLMLFAALGLDIGYLHYQKEQLQKAADAGAVAAATALSYGDDLAAITKAANNDITANGFQNGKNGVVVNVYNPPVVPDPFAGNTNYVQVIVTQTLPTHFRFISSPTVNVTGYSVANSVGNASGCLYALNPQTAPGTFVVDGGVTLGTSCGIYVESTSSSGLTNGGTISVGGVGSTIGVVAGSYSGGGITPTPVVNIPVFNDPLGTLPAPSVNLGNCNSKVQNNVYSQGCYPGGITVPPNGNYIFNPGTYILDGGGLTIPASSTVTGSNVMFYVTYGNGHSYGGVNLSGSANSSLSAPTSGTYRGILFFQDRSVPAGIVANTSTFNGTNGASFTGALYFSTTDVKFTGTPLFQSQVAIVAYQIEFTGNASIVATFLPNNGSPIPGAVLVE
jgi:Flp pilus assembly protein TadG